MLHLLSDLVIVTSLSIVCQFVIPTDAIVFKPAVHPFNGLSLCAVDPPSAVLSLADASVGIPPGVPETVVCSYGCTGYVGCISLN